MHRAIGPSVLAAVAVLLGFLPSAPAQINELTALQLEFAAQMNKIGDEAAAALKARQTAYAKELDALQTRL
jgi:hypothetical protein